MLRTGIWGDEVATPVRYDSRSHGAGGVVFSFLLAVLVVLAMFCSFLAMSLLCCFLCRVRSRVGRFGRCAFLRGRLLFEGGVECDAVFDRDAFIVGGVNEECGRGFGSDLFFIG